MCPDVDEYDLFFLNLEDCPIITGDIDTATIGICLLDRMVVEERMKWLVKQEILPLNELATYILRQFLEVLEKRPMQYGLHDPFVDFYNESRCASSSF